MMIEWPPAADPAPPVPPAADPTPLESVNAPAADVAEEPVPGCSHWSTPVKKMQKKKIVVPPTQMTTRSKKGKLFHFFLFFTFSTKFSFLNQ